MNIFDFEKNKMIPLTSKEYKSYLKQTMILAKKSSEVNTLLINNIVKLWTIVILQGNTEVLYIVYEI